MNETVHNFHLISLSVVIVSVLLFYLFFEVRPDSGRESVRSSTLTVTHMVTFGGGPAPTREPSQGVCPQCGIENDPEYTFCRECLGRLAAPRPRSTSRSTG